MSETVEEAASWLEDRIEQQGGGLQEGGGRRAVAIVRELRERLVRQGLDEDLAQALAPAPAFSVDEDSPQAVVHALQGTRRRLVRFAAASRRSPPPISEDAHDRLKSILEDPVFTSKGESASLMQRIVSALNRFLVPRMGRFFSAVARHPRLTLVVILLLAAAAAALILTRLAPWPRRILGPARLSSRSGTELTQAGGASPYELLDRARAAHAAGQRVRALKVVELAAVTALRGHGALPDQPGLTDLEGIRLLRGHADEKVRRSFERLATLHDRVVYGGLPPDEPTISEALKLASILVRRPARETA